VTGNPKAQIYETVALTERPPECVDDENEEDFGDF